MTGILPTTEWGRTTAAFRAYMKACRLLLVEDGEEIFRFLEGLKGEHPFEVVRAGSAREGMERAKEEEFDLALIHNVLPDLEGVDLLKKFRRSRTLKDLSIVFFGDKPLEAGRDEALAFGAADYIPLPVSGDAPRKTLIRWLRGEVGGITASPAANEDVRNQQANLIRLWKALELTGDAVVAFDAKGGRIHSNHSFHHLFGPADALVPQESSLAGLLVNPSDWAPAAEAIEATGQWTGELILKGKDGAPIPTLVRVSSCATETGLALGRVWVGTSLARRRELETALEDISRVDPVTGLLNRKAVSERLHAFVADTRQGQQCVLLFVDIDYFRVVNSAAGHSVGDRLLRDLAGLLREAVRKGDEVGRYGSDEFLVLLRGINEQTAVEIAQRLLRKFESIRFSEGTKFFPSTACVGIAPLDGTMSSDDAFKRAHAACQAAKARGRNGILVYSAELPEVGVLERQAGWAVQVQEALAAKRFQIYLQPILPLAPGVGRPYAEVLLRMVTPDGKVVLPAEFLPAAERFSTVRQLDEFSLTQAVALLADHPDLCLSVNLSGRTVTDPALPGKVAALLNEAGVDGAKLALEVTETTMVYNLSKASETLSALRKLGCKVFLDDFGAGASSMAYLRQLPVDVIKVEGSFVEKMESDPLNRSIVTAIVEIARAAGKLTVAEHVASAPILRQVRDLRVDYVQGWFVCEPMPPQELVKRGLSRMALY